MAMPLEGYRVLDLSMWQQGPVAATMLADMGAEVIKLERPDGGDPGRGITSVLGTETTTLNWYFENNNRNKKSVTLNLQHPESKIILHRLVKESDVFLQNFRPGVAKRLGVDYESLYQVNPRIIHASGSGYGLKGPEAERPAFDIIALARGGIMTMSGEPGAPPDAASSIADQTGATLLAYGIVLALLARERTGVGQQVDVSLLGGQIWLQGLIIQGSLFNLEFQQRRRVPRIERTNPLWNVYLCKDGKWLVLSMLQSDRYWSRFCKVLGIEQLENDTRFSNSTVRGENCQELISILDKLFATKNVGEWLDLLWKEDLISAQVQNHEDLPHDPQVLANDYIIDFEHPVGGKVQYVGIPVNLSATPGRLRHAAPELGQHTEEVLIEVAGYTWDEIAELRDKGVI